MEAEVALKKANDIINSLSVRMNQHMRALMRIRIGEGLLTAEMDGYERGCKKTLEIFAKTFTPNVEPPKEEG